MDELLMNELELTRLIRWGRSGDALRGEACPDEELISGYVDGLLSASIRIEVEDHVAECRYCLGQIGLLSRLREVREFGKDVPKVVLESAKRFVEAAGPFAGSMPLRWATGFAGGAIAAMLFLAIWLPQGGRVDRAHNPAVRAGDIVWAGPRIIQPLEADWVTSGEVEFRWTTVPGALSYQLYLVTGEGDIVWTVELEHTLTELPDEVIVQLEFPYFVWVRALLPDGKTLRSTAVGFQVRDRSRSP